MLTNNGEIGYVLDNFRVNIDKCEKALVDGTIFVQIRNQKVRQVSRFQNHVTKYISIPKGLFSRFPDRPKCYFHVFSLHLARMGHSKFISRDKTTHSTKKFGPKDGNVFLSKIGQEIQ